MCVPVVLIQGAEPPPAATDTAGSTPAAPTLVDALAAAESTFVRDEPVDLAALATTLRTHFESATPADEDRLLVERYLRLVLVARPSALPPELEALAASPSDIVRAVARERLDALKLSATLTAALSEVRQGRLIEIDALRGQIDTFLAAHPRSSAGRGLVENYMRLFQAVQLAQQAAEWRRFVASPNAAAADAAAERLRAAPATASATMSEPEMRERMERVAEEIRRRRDERRRDLEAGAPTTGRKTTSGREDVENPLAAERAAQQLERELLNEAIRERTRLRAASGATPPASPPAPPAPAK